MAPTLHITTSHNNETVSYTEFPLHRRQSLFCCRTFLSRKYLETAGPIFVADLFEITFITQPREV